MMRKKQLLLSSLVCMLVLPSFLVNANTTADDANESAETEKTEGDFTSKDEVVYANLKADGQLQEIYVVNALEVRKPGIIRDYGRYDQVKNLTDLSNVDQQDNTVLINAPEGTFYYQGNMGEDGQLPWNVDVTYKLDDKKIDPLELAGKSGHIQIEISTSKNEKIDPVFFENYLLQVSLTLTDKFSNVETSKGMVANAGENKQITFTVMPGEEEVLSVEADVVDFEFQGAQIAAVPSSLPIDTGEIGNMTDDMSSLSDAITEINNGVGDLLSGVTELNDGVTSLRDGSSQYKQGLTELDNGSDDLVNGSKSIDDALATISNSLANSEEMDLSQLSQLPVGLLEAGNGLLAIADGLTDLKSGYALSYGYLVNAINEIPDYQITADEMAALKLSLADQDVIDKLLKTYTAAMTVKGTYAEVKPSLEAVEPALDESSKGIRKIGEGLIASAEEISSSLEEFNLAQLAQLQKGLAELSSQYGLFHSGLVGYTEGVTQLADAYNEMHAGIEDLSAGTSEMENGVRELHDGTKQLDGETHDLPEQMQAEIDKMIGEYDKSDFKPVSFVSSKNEKVDSVQFVIKTESIEIKEQKTEEVQVEEKKGFWTLLKELFQKG